MANTPFYVPRLLKEGAWLDWRGKYARGFTGFQDIPLRNHRRTSAHHSVTNPTGNAERDCNTIFNIHAANGWNMIGYHFIITSEVVNGFAKVAYVGDIGTRRAAQPNQKGAQGIAADYGNFHVIAACIIGQNHITPPTAAQLRSMKLLQQELIWFERGRLPNIPAAWESMREHKIFDWTQCNGLDVIRSRIINAAIPAEAKPTPTPTPPAVPNVSKYVKLPKKTYELVRDANLWDFNAATYKAMKSTGSFKKGQRIDIVGKAIHRTDSEYFMTAYSFGSGDPTKSGFKPDHTNGINAADLKEYKAPAPAPKPEPVPKPTPPPAADPEKPEVRALGEKLVVKVDKGDKVIDVITGKVTREYTQDEPFEATHTITYKDVLYYMTTWAFEEYEAGKNPTGIDSRTVDAWVEAPPEVEDNTDQIPDDIEDEELPPEVIEDHERIVEELEGLKEQVSGLQKIVDAIVAFLKKIFNGF